MRTAIQAAMAVKDKPSMIKVTTIIGYGSLKQGTGGVHGSPLTAEDIEQFKKKFNISLEPFHVPQEYVMSKQPSKHNLTFYRVYDMYHAYADEGTSAEEEWTSLFQSYSEKYKDLYTELSRRLRGELPENWQARVSNYRRALFTFLT
jgi:transketolase